MIVSNKAIRLNKLMSFGLNATKSCLFSVNSKTFKVPKLDIDKWDCRLRYFMPGLALPCVS